MRGVPGLVALIVLLEIASLCAETSVSDDDLLEGVERLDAVPSAFHVGVDSSSAHSAWLPTVRAARTGNSDVETTDASWPTAQEYDYKLAGQTDTGMNEFSWIKDDYRIIPYGSLWGSASYDTSRSDPGPFVLFVSSPDLEGEPAFNIDTRRTRLGLDILGPNIPLFNHARSRGQVEIDFHGAFVVENRPGVLLRHAYAEIYDDYFRLLAGQYWDVISPLYPGTLSYSKGFGGGNIGFRRMQVRVERNLASSEQLRQVLQTSISQNIVSDFQGTAEIEPEATGWPILQGRAAAMLSGRGVRSRPITFGISGHIGEQGFDFVATGLPPPTLPPTDDARVKTWSFNFDFSIPIQETCGVHGEFFTGLNLSTFLGGIVQGVDLTSREGVRSTGGWLEAWYDWSPRLHSRAGFGIDDPRNKDLSSGRTYNRYIYVNSSFDVTTKLNVGVEITSWKTLYQRLGPAESVRFEFAGNYDF